MIKLQNITKIYHGVEDVLALDDISLDLKNNGIIFIVGESGSGKSTLLNIIGNLDNYDSGNISYSNKNDLKNEAGEYCASFVFQSYNLINDFTVYDNLSFVNNDDNINRILKLLGLELNLLSRDIRTLSGGQKQRIAIARALLNKADILLMDEPTGNLDYDNSIKIFDILKKISKSIPVLVVTHNLNLAQKFADEIIHIQNGIIEKKDVINREVMIVEECNLDSSILRVYEFILNNNLNSIEFFTIIAGKRDTYSFKNNDQLFELILDVFRNNKGSQRIEFGIVNSTYTNNYIDDNSERYVDFSPYFQFKYALNLIMSSSKRFILSILIFIITLSLLISEFNIININEESIISEALDTKEPDRISFGLNKCNIYLNECCDYYNGEFLFDSLLLEFEGENIHKYNSTAILRINDIVIPITIIILNTGDGIFEGEIVKGASNPLTNSQIGISDYLSYLLFEQENQSLIGEEILLNNYLEFEVGGIISTDYIENDILTLNFYESNKNKYVDEYTYEYQAIYMTEEDYDSYIIGSSINGSGIVSEEYISTNDYLTINVKYGLLENQDLIWGQIPASSDEVVISTEYANKIFSDMNNFDIEELVNYRIHFKDLSKSINYMSYLGDMNFNNIFPEDLKIVGVYNSVSSDPDVLLTQNAWEELKNTNLFYSVDGFLVSSSNKKIIDFATEENYFLSNKIGQVTESVTHLFGSSLSNVIIYLIIGFLTLTILLIFSNSSYILNDRKREFGILKSLRISHLKIANIFVIYNLVFFIISFILSIFVSMVSVAAMNKNLGGSDLFNIGYNIIPFGIKAIIITGAISLIFIVFSIFVPLNRIKNLTPVDVIREGE